MRKINNIIIHCTATPEARWVTNEEITRWHKARGFRTIGYHYVVYLDGTGHVGRPENEIGAHCQGRNADSIGVCYVGGLDKSGKPKDTRTPLQKQALTRLLKHLRAKYPNAVICGHRDFANKACPCFGATSGYKAV